VPVLTKGRSGQKINQVEINQGAKAWNKRCWKSIQYNCAQAEYFDNYQDFFSNLYNAESWSNLVDLNLHIIDYIARVLEMGAELVSASDLGVSGRTGTELLLGICQQLGADVYISGRFGRDYLDEPQFHQQGIQVVYQDFQHPEYPQVYEPFVPNMSVIDLLFNCGEGSKEIICQA
jgi:hypothetical protein